MEEKSIQVSPLYKRRKKRQRKVALPLPTPDIDFGRND